ncbi:hypothetical protein CJ030_MR1G001727 [Morella rubra]|uniref:Uncharacterized protein n=1 Tax=Morella rubra TaxID=262757 RepID=A0A6A1WM36_9ROSI|nr:hypothetical protein CJ030_MR1G001727 [Morella rubra]
MGWSDVEPIEILRVVLDDPDLTEIEKPIASDLHLHRRRQMNLGHLLLNYMKATSKNTRQGLPYGMLFTQLFDLHDVEPMVKKERNQRSPGIQSEDIASYGICTE